MGKEVIEAPLYDHKGEEKGRRKLPPGVFLQDVNEGVLYQAVRAYQTNRRQGSVSTKSRSTIRGGGSKPWRQKGTGRARAGSSRSPLWRGGATTFRLTPKDYRMKLPKRLKRIALYSALSQKAQTEAIKVFDYFEFSIPKTKEMAGLLDKVGVQEKKVLILTNEIKREVHLSGRNIPGVKVQPFKDISALEILNADVLLIEDGVVETLEATENIK